MHTKAIIFDLDGVLTDTSEYHYRAWKKLADDEGIPFTRKENDTHLRGVSRHDSLLYIIRDRHYTDDQIREMMDRKNKYYNKFVEDMTPNEVVAGGRELLTEIRRAGLKTAIASASKNCRMVLDLLQIAHYFDGIADGYCIVNGKPAPDIFIFAAGLVNIPTPDCLGIEDATAGVEAIKAAGMHALGIGPQERFPHADKVLPNMENKHLRDILIE
jgi:beta-phosphoglucomutase